MHCAVWVVLWALVGLLVPRINTFIIGPSNTRWERRDIDALVGRHYSAATEGVLPEKYGNFGVIVLKQGTDNRGLVMANTLYVVVDANGIVRDWTASGLQPRIVHGGIEGIMYASREGAQALDVPTRKPRTPKKPKKPEN